MFLVYVTAKDENEAKNIGNVLIKEQLAACVNIVPLIRSVYRWQGDIVNDEEALLIAKTTQNQLPKLTKRIKDLHSYTTPSIVWWRLDGSDESFLRWICESVESKENFR